MLNNDYTVRELPEEQAALSAALALVWRVFQEFEAPDYSEEGIQAFQDFIAPAAVQRKIEEKELAMWGCFDGEKIIGVIALRLPCHIALLFVDKAWHRRGVARSLLDAAVAFCIKEGRCREMTVHSSPYAVPAYRRLGFADTGAEQTVDGLRFTPMKHMFR